MRTGARRAPGVARDGRATAPRISVHGQLSSSAYRTVARTR